jgi:hypothetical protein
MGRKGRPRAAEAILAVRPKVTAGQRVDVLPAWEMIADLMEQGYSRQWVSAALGNTGPLQLGWDTCSALNLVRIKRLWDTTTTPRVCATKNELSACNRAKHEGAALRRKLSRPAPVRMVTLDEAKLRRIISDTPIAAFSAADQRSLYRAPSGRPIKEATAERILSALRSELQEAIA